MKISIIVPVYYNESNLYALYEDLKCKVLTKIEQAYEIVFVNDGSKDGSLRILKELAEQDNNIKVISLSRNFGSHAAILCGLSNCTGDCAVVKAADLQEPSDKYFPVECIQTTLLQQGIEEQQDTPISSNLSVLFAKSSYLLS